MVLYFNHPMLSHISLQVGAIHVVDAQYLWDGSIGH